MKKKAWGWGGVGWAGSGSAKNKVSGERNRRRAVSRGIAVKKGYRSRCDTERLIEAKRRERGHQGVKDCG